MPPSPWFAFVAGAALVSSCAVKEQYSSIAVDPNDGASLEKREIVSSWWGDFPKEQERPHPLGSAEGNRQWTVASSAAGAAAEWKASEDQREGENTFRLD